MVTESNGFFSVFTFSDLSAAFQGVDTLPFLKHFLPLCFFLGLWDTELLVFFLLLLLVHLFPMHIIILSLDSKYMQGVPDSIVILHFPFYILSSKFIASSTICIQMTCELVSKTLLLRSSPDTPLSC